MAVLKCTAITEYKLCTHQQSDERVASHLSITTPKSTISGVLTRDEYDAISAATVARFASQGLRPDPGALRTYKQYIAAYQAERREKQGAYLIVIVVALGLAFVGGWSWGRVTLRDCYLSPVIDQRTAAIDSRIALRDALNICYQ